MKVVVETAAQPGLCGVVPPIGNVSKYNAIAIDRFGNYYSAEMITIPETVPSQGILNGGGGSNCGCEEFEDEGISLSLFEPYFEDCMLSTGNGFNHTDEGPARRKVVCAVLQYLETVIVPNNSVCNSEEERVVNIQIQPSFAYENYIEDYDLDGFDPDVLGYGSFYYGISSTSIKHPLPWTIINSGEYPPSSNASSYHALIRFNFEDIADFVTEYDSGVIDGHDLYSVVLHEVVHSLGFASSFSNIADGNELGSINPNEVGAYYPFDEFLSFSNEALIERSLPVGNQQIGAFHSFNPNLTYTDFFSGCPDNSGTNVIFNGALINGHNIYIGDNLESGTSFSHISGECVDGSTDFIDFVMNPELPENIARRMLLDAELDIMRRIGYNIDCNPDDYTLFDCSESDCAVGAAADGVIFDNCNPNEVEYTLSICQPEEGSLVISVQDLLYNDPNATGIAYIINEGNGEVEISLDETEITFTTNILGLNIISYAVIGCNGQVSNSSNLYINVVRAETNGNFSCPTYCPDPTTCEETSFFGVWDICETLDDNCNTNSCNLICNGGICGYFAFREENGAYQQIGDDNYTRIAPLSLLEFDYVDPGVSAVGIKGWFRGAATPDLIVASSESSPFLGGALTVGYSPTFPEQQTNKREELYTYVSTAAGKNYIYGFDVGEVPSPDLESVFSLKMSLIYGEDYIPSDANIFGPPPFYEGSEQIIYSVIDGEYISERFRQGGTFTCNEDFTALRIGAAAETSEFTFTILDDIELVEDNFFAGDDITSTYCGQIQQLGGLSFCMLSNVEVLYEWFELDAEGNPIEPALHTYTVLNELASNSLDFQVAPNQTTNYRLVRTITDYGGLPENFSFDDIFDEITITVLGGIPTPDFTFTETIDCGVFNFFSDDSTLGDEHEWYVDDMLVSTEPNPIGVALSDGDHTITHIVTGQCGEAQVATIQIDNVDCIPDFTCPCEDPSTTNIVVEADTNEGTLWHETALASIASTGLLSPNTIDLNSYCVSISGIIIIDSDDNTQSFQSDVLFTGGALRMAPDAQIIVRSGASLMFWQVDQADEEGTGIHSCGDQWQGITVEGGGELRFYGSQIEGAIQAIHAMPDATLDISNNVFNNNNVGLFLGESTPDLALHNINLGINGIINNTFENGAVGISAIQTSWVILGSLTGDGINTYRNLVRGVIIQHGNIGVYNSTFEYITLEGIVHFNGNGFLFAFNNFFDNMAFGIQSLNGSILAVNNFMTNISNTGVSLTSGITEFTVTECINNSITADIAGIDLNFEALDNRIHLDKNEVILTATEDEQARAGIRILGEGENATSWEESLVRNNSITINSLGTGIELMNMGNIDIHYNEITFQNPITTNNGINRGISLENTDENYLYDNTVIVAETAADFTDLTAFHLAASLNTLLCCNSTQGGNIGFLFSENCNGTEFRNSDIGDHQVGLEVAIATTTGTQNHVGNLWNGTYSEAGARNWGESQDEVSVSAFELETPNPDRPELWPELILTPALPDAIWFTPEPGNADFCETDDLCLPVPSEEKPLKEEDIKFARGEHQGSSYFIFQDWEGSKYLYGKLTDAPGLINAHPRIQAFYNTGEEANYSDFLAMSQAIKELRDENLMADLQADLSQIQEWVEKMTELEASYNASTDEAEQEQLSVQYNLLKQNIDVLLASDYQLHVTQTGVRVAAIPQLLTQNANLVAEHDYAQYEKEVNAIQLTLLQESGLSELQLSQLEYIAHKCPLEGGNAVYRARAILKGYGTYNFASVDCDDIVMARQQDNVQSSNQQNIQEDASRLSTANQQLGDWKIYPNPAENFIQLIGKDRELLGEVFLFSIGGERLASWSGSQTYYQLPTHLPDGLYFVKIQQADGYLETIKIIIFN